MIGGEGLDFYNYIYPVGEMEVSAKLLGPEELIALGIEFRDYEFDANGDRVNIGTEEDPFIGKAEESRYFLLCPKRFSIRSFLPPRKYDNATSCGCIHR